MSITSNKFSFFRKTFLVSALAIGLVNCKSDKVEVEEVFDFSKTFPDVAVTPVTITKPAATTYTPASLTVPAAFTALAASSGTSNTPPAELVASASKISPSLESAASAALTPAVLADITAGKPVSADVQKVLSDLIKSGELNAFLPTKTPASVDGKVVNGRAAGSSGKVGTISGGTEVFSTANACNDAIKKAFDDAKKILDDGLAAETAKIKAAYDENIKAAVVTVEKQNALKRRDDQLVIINKFLNDGLKLGSKYTPIIVAIYMDYFNANEEVYNNEIKGLDAKAKAISDKAVAVRDADNKKVTDEYNTKLSPIKAIFDKENSNCHNQGGGK